LGTSLFLVPRVCATTVTIDGVPRTTITLGAAASGAGNLRTYGTAAAMV
jgi:hypothetical protein